MLALGLETCFFNSFSPSYRVLEQGILLPEFTKVKGFESPPNFFNELFKLLFCFYFVSIPNRCLETIKVIRFFFWPRFKLAKFWQQQNPVVELYTEEKNEEKNKSSKLKENKNEK